MGGRITRRQAADAQREGTVRDRSDFLLVLTLMEGLFQFQLLQEALAQAAAAGLESGIETKTQKDASVRSAAGDGLPSVSQGEVWCCFTEDGACVRGVQDHSSKPLTHITCVSCPWSLQQEATESRVTKDPRVSLCLSELIS
ncbi:hypothetical protein EYF80_025334 [Liparis tanakae]|uniref:Uncharacterized protein n=1 Tax=Liparis tanakae TaxID=230148 RepID=A0A4Z2HHR3_9TELE|nr:hypothetical protein EYF80_025334 [Liparis tanakae]